MGNLLDKAIENAPNRRSFLSKTALFGAATIGAAGLRLPWSDGGDFNRGHRPLVRRPDRPALLDGVGAH